MQLNNVLRVSLASALSAGLMSTACSDDEITSGPSASAGSSATSGSMSGGASSAGASAKGGSAAGGRAGASQTAAGSGGSALGGTSSEPLAGSAGSQAAAGEPGSMVAGAGGADAGAAGATGAAGAGATLPDNLVTNPGFEVDASGWSVNGAGSLTVSSAYAHSGSMSGLLSGRMNGYEGPAYDLSGKLTPGVTYYVEGYVFLDSATPKTTQITLKYACMGQSTEYHGLATIDGSNAGFVKLAATFSIPDCTATGVAIYFEAPGDDRSDLYVDDIWVSIAI